MCCVLNHAQRTTPGDRQNSVHVAGQSAEMDRNNGLRSGCNSRFNETGIDVERLRVDIDKDRMGAKVSDDLCRSRKGIRRSDDFVTIADSDRFECKMQTGCCRVYGQSL